MALKDFGNSPFGKRPATLSNHGSVVAAPVAPHVIAPVSVVGSDMRTADAVIVTATAAAPTITTEAATKVAAAESTSSRGAAAIGGKRTG
jgi:hypothetical protein